MSDEPVGSEASAPGCSILLVEDNPINQKVVKLMLGRFRIIPAIASSGIEAIGMVENQTFDLILMDLHMPGMDGVEAVSKIRELLGEQCPPIVALTADSVFNLDGDMRQNGFNGFLTKPVNADTFRKCILEHTGKAY